MTKKKHEQGHYQSQQEVEVYDESRNEVESDEDDAVAPRTKRTKRPPRTSQYKGQGKRITVPILKLSAGDVLALEFTGEKRLQKIGNDDKPPALMYRVTDLDTGEISDLIATKVLSSTIDKIYPDGAIAGKKLLLECDQRSDKKYLDVLISELE